MSPHEHETTRVPALRGGLTLDDRLDDIESLLREVRGDLRAQGERLAKGDTELATLNLRLAGVERIVYGLCGVVLLSVLGAIVGLVVTRT